MTMRASPPTAVHSWRDVVGYCGAQIRQAREAKGWSQTTLADLAGLTQPLVSRIETGEVMDLSDHHYALAGALGVPFTACLPPLPPGAIVLADPTDPLYHLCAMLRARHDGHLWAEQFHDFMAVKSTAKPCYLQLVPGPPPVS